MILSPRQITTRRYYLKHYTRLKLYRDTVRKTRRRDKSFGNRTCRICEILLKDEYGARGSRFYCKGCIDRGIAKKHANKLKKQRYLNKHGKTTSRGNTNVAYNLEDSNKEYTSVILRQMPQQISYSGEI